MSKKVYYRFNDKTRSYERVYPSRRSRWLATLGHLVISLLLGAGVFLLLNGVIDLPKERMLRAENRQLKDDLELLNARMDRAQAVMSDLADRDKNFYRVMMQADRISDAKRYAGLERSSLYAHFPTTPLPPP